MKNNKPNQCKSKDCCNPVIAGNYCENCKKRRQEKRGDFLKVAGGAAATIGSIALAIIFKRPPKAGGK